MSIVEFDSKAAGKISIAEKIVVPHRYFLDAVNRVEQARSLTLHGAEPRRILLVGESGAGKTLVARYIQSCHLIRREEGRLIRPILYVETPPTPTLKSFGESLLIALGDPFAHRGSSSEKLARALELIKAQKIELMIFDEFQHFLDNSRGNSISAVADWFKSLIDDTRVPCLLMGLPRCEAILKVNEQLRRRFSSRIELPSFSIDTEKDETDLRTVLNEIDHLLPTERRSNFSDIDMARRFYFASNGLIGYIKKLVVGSYELMLEKNGAFVDRNMLKEAFVREVWCEGIEKLNPFDSQFVFRNLNRLGEPFYVLPEHRKNSLKQEGQ
jgi:hypothetical protein